MVEFERLANSEGGNAIYQKVANRIDVKNHPAFLRRPIKILDLAGGSGNIGLSIKKQLDNAFGSLSLGEFGLLIDYVNLDIDQNALKKSLGRVMCVDISESCAKLCCEEPFDFVLSINPSPAVRKYTLQDVQRMPENIAEALLSSPSEIRNYLERILLISTSLLLQERGKYVWSGFINKDSFDGTMTFIQKNNLGLRIEKFEEISLDEATKNLFVMVDTDRKSGSKSFDKVKAKYGSYRLVSMEINGFQDRAKLVNALDKQISEHHQWVNFCRTQDIFGTW